ncbi:hypothetical protein DVA67_001895 [Solirubrobacter sp. CPCC 204708]|uniref:Uncharacterized protein n=1 Tax=Solirubrobacter deserti TaxID=2282478 RepID=A0ABT4RR18_9ACTN|nr:hypothetical protein [Solirubrobacter deserti]MBE2314710.1 hypothetical protein [Solirubrobacter deserti]MDA0141027.1 hypothetical protein [Solirubrobacter deserti]
MSALLAIVALLALAPAAHAGTLGREGSELVFRAAPGADDAFFATAENGVLRFTGDDVTPGEGCGGREVTCALDGVTAIRLPRATAPTGSRPARP